MKKLVVEELRKAGTSEIAASKTVDEVIGAIKSVIGRGEKVVIPNFGTFVVKRRDERTARNPRTGETVKVAARDVLNFKPSKTAI